MSSRLATHRSPLSMTMSMRKELGVLVLLLAAETVVAGEASQRIAINHSEGNTVGVVTTPTLAKEALLISETSSTGGETDSAGYNTPLPHGEEGMFTAYASSPLVFDAAMISIILSYLPWKKVIDLRRISKQWLHASISVATLCRMPGSGSLAAFVPCHEDFDATEMEDEQALMCNHGDTWKCEVCGFWNAPARIMCGNRACQVPAPSHQSAVRIFLGQLRRSGTVSFIKWLANNIIQDSAAIMNVENHRHKVTGRGKGCAWVYVSNETSAMNLISYHRRVFLDIVGGVEGVWITKPDDIPYLDATVESRSFSPLATQRPRHLPRNSLVVELPSMSQAHHQQQQQQQHHQQEAAYYHQAGAEAWGNPYQYPPQGPMHPMDQQYQAAVAAAAAGASPPPYYPTDPYAANMQPQRQHQHQPYATTYVPTSWDGTV